MKDENQFERTITKELKKEVGKNFEWVEWSTSEKQVRKNLQEGEATIFLTLGGVWVAYREKKGKSNEKN